MPVCYLTLSEKVKIVEECQIMYVRKIVAEGLDSKSRNLDENHISLRVQYSQRKCMLSDIEIEIFSQLYLRRMFNRDKRSSFISEKISRYFQCGCATWINMGYVGYSRNELGGKTYFSDSNNPFIRIIQKIKGVSSKELNEEKH